MERHKKRNSSNNNHNDVNRPHHRCLRAGAYLNSLPDVTITLIMHYLPMKSLFDFSTLCKRFRRLLTCYHVVQSSLPGVSIVPDQTLYRPFFHYIGEEVHPRTLYEQKTLLLFAILQQMGYSTVSSYLDNHKKQGCPKNAKEWMQSLDMGMSMQHLSFFVALIEHILNDSLVHEHYRQHIRFVDPTLEEKLSILRLQSCLAAIHRKGIFCSLPITERRYELLDSLGTKTEYTLTELSDYYSLYSSQRPASSPAETMQGATMALSHHIVPSYNLHAQASVEQLKALKETQLSSIDVEDNEQDINDLFRGGGPFPYISHVDLEKESYELSCHAAVQNQTLLQKFQFQRTQLENQIPKDQAEDKTFQNFVRDISAHLRNEWLVSRSVLRLLQDLVEGVHYGSIFLQCKIKISPDSQTFSHGDTFYPDGEFDALILMGENGVIVRSVHKLIDGSLYDCMAEILEQRHGYEEQDEDYVYENEEDVVMKDY